MQRHYGWEMFRARFTADDLALVCRELRKRVKDGKRNIASLAFRFLVLDLDSFEELLAECRAVQRKPFTDSGKAAVLRATGRPDESPTPPAQSAGVTLERSKLAAQLREFKKTL